MREKYLHQQQKQLGRTPGRGWHSGDLGIAPAQRPHHHNYPALRDYSKAGRGGPQRVYLDRCNFHYSWYSGGGFFNYVALDLRYVCENNSPGNINHQEKDKRDDGFAPEL